jgi:hypothetical protein
MVMAIVMGTMGKARIIKHLKQVNYVPQHCLK